MKKCNRKRAWAYILSLFMFVQAVIVPIPAFAGIVEESGEYEVYPVPQAVEYAGGTMTLTLSVDVTYGEGIDSYTQKKTEKALSILGLSQAETSDNAHTKLVVGIYGKADMASYSTSLGAQAFFTGTVDELTGDQRFDKYILNISEGQIVILGEDTDAAFRGVTTLQRIFEQVSNTDKSIKKLTIKDYAEIASRGFIEGYYGNPWSHEDRMDLMQYGGEIKMNQYVFAPKDDPYHRTQWRDLYPETGEKNSLTQIRELAKVGNENKCYYVYALHPFYNNKITLENYDQDIAALKAKFEQVINAGVRQIAILEDDGNAHSNWEKAAEILIKVLNDMSEWLEQKKNSNEQFSDLKTELLFCPGFMAYSNDMTNSNSEDVKKIQEVHANVGENVRIVMTGGKIWGDVTTTFADNFYNKVEEKKAPGRYPYLWVNWPCSDNTHDSLVMGGHNSILKPNLDGYKYHGIIFNPMQDSEPSKVGLFTGADFCWNVWRGEDAQAKGDQAWVDSFKYIDHMTAEETESSQKLRAICQHMITQSDTQADRTGAKFEESLNIKDVLLAVQTKLEEDSELSAEEISTIETEFTKIQNDVKYYITDGHGTNRRMASQLTPYAKSLSDVAGAGVFLMQALEAIQSGNDTDVYPHFASAQELYERSKTYMFLELGNPIYAKGGRRYIIPFVEAALEYVSEEAKKIVDPEHVLLEKKILLQVGGSKVKLSDADVEKITDNDLLTNIVRQTKQLPGDYVGMSFNMPVEVSNIKIYLSRTGNPNDYIAEGVLEYTEDGKTWQAFANQPTIGADVSYELDQPMILKGFRLKCTEQIPSGDTAINRWLAIREIGYNTEGDFGEAGDSNGERYEASYSRTDYWTVYQASDKPETNITDGNDSTFVWYDPSKSNAEGEKDWSLKDEYIQLDLGEAKPVGLVRVLLGDGSSADKWTNYHLEYSVSGNEGDWNRMNSVASSGTDDKYEVNLNGVQARYIRLVNDKAVKVWIKFREFSVYPYIESTGDVMDYTNTADINADWRVEYGEESAKIFPKESAVLQPDEYIGLKLDRIHAVSAIQMTGTGMDSLTLEKSVNDSEWTNGEKGNARYIRLMNKTDAAVTFSLNSFVVTLDEVQAMHFEAASQEPTGPYADQDARNQSTTGKWVDGDKNTTAKYCFAADTGDYVTYDLGQEVNLHAVKIWVSNNAGDYPRKAEVRAALSADSTDWKTLITIDGDGSDSTFNITPVNNGWNAGEGAVDVNYAYVGGELDESVKARYIQIYFTGYNAGRYVEISELEINNNEYLPSINDPTFELTGNAVLQKGMEPQNLIDGNLTSAFRPVGSSSGSLIYSISEGTENVNKINILQSGSSISNATVSVRTGADQWETIGTLYRSFSSFYTGYYENVYDVKLEWENVIPVIYEIITLQNPDNVLERNLQDAQNQVANAQTNLNEANEALTDITGKVEEAEAAMNQAADGSSEKLKAEADYYRLRAEKYGLEADVAQYTALKLIGEAELARAEAQNLRAEAANKTDESEKNQLIQQAEEKEAGISGKLTEAQTYQATAAEKRILQAADEKTAADKKSEYEASATVYYNVTFESNGGSEVDNQRIKANEKVEKPVNPTRTGYIFDKWYSDENLTIPYNFRTAVTADMILYAGWTEEIEPKEYTVTFDSKGGSKVDPMKVEEGGKVEEPEAPTREHYIFDGWFKDEALQTEFDFSKETVESDITLYAKWTPDSSGDVTFYKVTFNSNGGTLIAEQDVLEGNKLIEPNAPTKDGFTFDGWYTDASIRNKYDFNTPITKNITLYAKWIQEGGSEDTTYTVAFESNGGSKIASQTVKEGEKAVKPKTNPTRSGYTFAGWYDKALTKAYDFNTAVTGNLTLYAKWTKIPAPKPVTYKVTFISNGGTTVAPKTVNQNSTVPLVSPTRKDYKFDGWYTDKACTKKFAPGTKITRNLTLYAKWIPLVVLPEVGEKKTVGDLVYKITVSHATEGTVSVAGMSKTSKKKITIPPTVTIDNIVYKVTSIDSKAFTKGKKMTTVEIGANVAKIDARAFYNCKKLKTIKFKTAKTPKFGSKVFKGTNSKCKVYAAKAMSKKEFNNFKKKCKSAGMSKKASYKRK